MAAAGDRQARFEAAFETVYEPLQRYFGRRAVAADVDDLLNEALAVIWRRLDDIPDDAILPWSYGVAKRCLANRRRADARHLRLVGRLAAQPASGPAEGPDRAAGDHDELHRALAALDQSEQELVRLWAWEQLEPREIAVVLDTTPNAVSLRLTRAKKKLTIALERQNPADAGHEAVRHRKEYGS